MKEDFDWAVAEVINNISLSGAASYFEPIVDRVETLKGQYGKLLRASAIGRDQAPIFGVKVEWKDISDKWKKRKRTYPRSAFYRGISSTSESLAKELFSLPSERLFGKTTLRTRLEQVETPGFYNPRIRRQISTVFRDDYGRFARASEQARRSVKVVVNPFPNINRDDPEALIRKLPIDPKNKLKLLANNEDRPLIEPYTEWFFERKIRSAIIDMAQRLR